MADADAPDTPLRRVRKERGLRLEDLASMSGVSQRTVFDAERERHKPHHSTRKLLAQALGMEERELWPT